MWIRPNSFGKWLSRPILIPEPSPPFQARAFSFPLSKPTSKARRNSFEGLAIEKMETEWKQYPVLHLDLNAEKYDSPERLGNILSNQLTQLGSFIW